MADVAQYMARFAAAARMFLGAKMVSLGKYEIPQGKGRWA